MAGSKALVLLYDIRGFTAASRRVSTSDLSAFATGAHRAVLDLFAARPPTFVKHLGDGHLLLWETSDPPDPALVAFVVEAAAKARTAFAAYVAGRAAGGGPLPSRVGVGVAYGEVHRADDYYGVALNLAARLQNLARPEGLAMDTRVFDLAAARDETLRRAFTKARVRLKGLGSTLVWVARPFSWGRLLGRLGRVAAVLALPLLFVALADLGVAVPGGDATRDALDRWGVSVFRPVGDDASVRASAARIRRDLSQRLLSVQRPQGWVYEEFSDAPTKPLDVWSSSQAICALLACPETPSDRLAACVAGLREAFEAPSWVERDGRAWGWLAHADYGYTEAEPTLWTWAALAVALGREGAVAEAERPEVLALLEKAQRAATTYHPVEDGGWNIFPDQDDPRRHSPYSTSLALLALLETRAAGLPFLGSVERRDALLASTARFVIGTFDAAREPRGWHRTDDPQEPVSPGLSLQNYALLLRAEREAGVALPAAIVDEVPRALVAVQSLSVSQPADAGEFAVLFTSHLGVRERRNEGINFLWHPWAVAAARRFVERDPAGRSDGDLDRLRARRVLRHLVVERADEVVAAASRGYVFVASETVYALSAVPR